MNKSIHKLGLLCLITTVLALAPQMRVRAADMPASESATKKEGEVRKSGVIPFHGKLKAVDKNAKTITVGETTVQITSETKIQKDGKPATLDDGIVGEPVGGAYKKSEAGKLNATSLRFGAKAEEEKKEKKTKKEKS